MTRGRSIVTGLAVMGALIALTPFTVAQSVEELEKKVAELTKRVEALERQLQEARKTTTEATSRPRAQSTTAAADAGREEALALYHKIDGLVATGNLTQAQRELTAYNEKHAGTRAAGWTRSLSRELEVVGKEAPTDWMIEKWYQGESEITLDGTRPTLLVFWESWCPHCRSEVPKMQQVYDRYKDEGLQVLGVTRITKTATEESVASFIKDQNITFPMAKETGDLATYFNVKGIPAAAMVKRGKIVWRGHPIRLTDELLGIWF
jgi:thiol-disulfide isomerase/thioredoxin